MSGSVLVVASVASMIDQFNLPSIKLLKSMGFNVSVACNFIEGNNCSAFRIERLKQELNELGVEAIQIDFARSPLKILKNIRAYGQLLGLMRLRNYCFVHCHSPVGGVCARIAGYFTQTDVIYTAHGFHFYKGAPLINWIVYYPIERFLARFTYKLITINQEDYASAKKFLPQNTVYLPGVGVNFSVFHPVSGAEKYRKRANLNLGLTEKDMLLVCVGELNKNKNQIFLLESLGKLLKVNPHAKMLLVGQGSEETNLAKFIAENSLAENAFLLGYRTDVADILNACDIGVSASIREGLPVNVIEYLASGLPVICSDNRGHRDLALGNPVAIFKSNDSESFFTIASEMMDGSLSYGPASNLSCFGEQNILSALKQIYGEKITHSCGEDR